jgi:nucleotide-binding universal stress UspA family protein
MPLKDLLVSIAPEDLRATHPAARFAIGLAQRCDAHLTALVVALAGEAASPLRESHQAAAAAEAESFSRRAERAGIRYETVTERVGGAEPGDVLAERARLHDLAILPASDRFGTSAEAVEAVLTRSGRPALIVPEATPGFACTHVALAWDGTAPAARALREGLPLMRLAGQATVFTIADDRPDHLGEVGQALCRHLGRHGIQGRFHHATSGGRPTGEALGAVARELGADVLAMGAFAHSPWRDLLVGSASRAVLADPPMPVLLST